MQMKMFRGLNRDSRGVTGIILGLVIAMVTMIVGLFIFAKIQTQIPQLENDIAQSAMDNMVATSYDVWGLVPIILIVLVAASIIGVIVGFGQMGGGGRR